MKGNKQIELKAQRYLYERAHLSGSCVSDYAWKIYNFILDYKNGKFGEDLTLQQAIDKYFEEEQQ